MLRAAAGRVALRAGDVETARSLLEHATDMARAAAHPSQTAGILVTLADARLADGDRPAARAALAEAREIADNDTVFPATLRRIKVAEQRMGHGAVQTARRGGALVEELTDRELSVLRALQGPAVPARDRSGPVPVDQHGEGLHPEPVPQARCGRPSRRRPAGS